MSASEEALHSCPVIPSKSIFTPLSQDEVSIDGGFWGDLRALNTSAILRHAHLWMTRLGWIENFTLAASGSRFHHKGMQFADSEVYKLIEALSWATHGTDEPELTAILESLIVTVTSAQEPDGYLHTLFGRAWQSPRYSDMQWGHELYCFGHFIQAAVANHRATGDTRMYLAAIRLADHICVMFGTDGYERICGHPEIEVALAELYRESGEKRYLEQARIFLDRRGRGLLPPHEFGRSYWQDDEPIRSSRILRGHAVRALYLAAGAIDASIESGDAELFHAVEEQWRRTIERRTYITGGMGSHHMDEAFGEDFVLPADRSYCETCAGVAAIMVAWRLLLATGEARYGDAIERFLFNIIATSPAHDGKAFFYANTLHQRTTQTTPTLDDDGVVIRGGTPGRQHWFQVSCCPPNVARILGSLNTFIATSDASGVHVHQYASGTVSALIPGGRVSFSLTTDYPHSGTVKVDIHSAPDSGFALRLRVPAWAAGATLVDTTGTEEVVPGTYAASIVHAGDSIQLELPMVPRLSYPDPRIDAIRGTVAVERGPEVLALEGIDLPEGWDLERIVTNGELSERDGRTYLTVSERLQKDHGWPYGPLVRDVGQSTDSRKIPLIAYHDWAERGPSTMRVFIPIE